jgi:hypothetical protein
MRRFTAVFAALLLALAVAAPAAAGPNVSNSSGGFNGAEADWGTYDEATGVSDYGLLFVRVEKGQKAPIADFQRNIEGQWVDCDGPAGKTVVPRDTDPGGDGDYSYTYMSAFGPASSLLVPKSMATATATATLTVWYETHEACTDVWDSGEMTIDVGFDLTATGPVERYSDRTTFHVPGQTNSWYSVKQVTRPAAGVVTVDGGEMTADFGIIGSVSFMEHVNG